MSKHLPKSAPRTSPTGRDELNLIDFPISVLQHQQPKNSEGKRPDELVCTIESYDRHLDRIVPRKLTRRTSSKYGFPTPNDEVVLVALLTLSRIKNDFRSPRVQFRNSELYELMGWPHNGNSNEKLSVALDRLKGLDLEYVNAWTTGADQFKKKFHTGLLDSYEFMTRTGSGSGVATSWIQWTSEIFADIQQGNVKQLDTDRFFALKLAITKRMYRFLDNRFRESSQFEMDLLTFAAHVGISGTSHIGKIKERLSDSITELEQLGDFIEATEQRYMKQGVGRWSIRFSAVQVAALRPIHNQVAPRTSTLADNDTATKLVSDFYRSWNKDDVLHRVTKHERSQAQEVIDRYGEEMAGELLPLVIRQMRKQWPDAKRFGAATTYWPDAEKILRRRRSVNSFENSGPAEDEHRQQERDRRKRLRKQLYSLSEDERASIFDEVSRTADNTVQRFIAQGEHGNLLVEIACLNELERRLADERSTGQPGE